MSKKCLIAYSSISGNTEKIAWQFKSTLEKQGWNCDMFQADKKTDLNSLPYMFNDYDFACIGSGVRMHAPYDTILSVVRKQFYGAAYEPIMRGLIKEQYGIELEMTGTAPKTPDTLRVNHRRIIPGANSKKAVVFVTYAGYELGPKEAVPAMQLLALEIEHLGFECIGQFCCPGKSGKTPRPDSYHGDITNRPDERDLIKAEMFIEEKLEEIADRPA